MMTRFLDCSALPSRHIVWLTCAIIFGLTALVAVRSGDDLRYLDEKSYDQLARQLIAGQGHVSDNGRPTAFRPPGYPWLLSAVYRLWPRPLAAKLVNVFFLACVAGLLAEIVGAIAPGGKSFAPLLVLLYPLFSYTASTLYPQTFGTLLFVAGIYFLVCFPDALLAAPASGLAFGALILTVPSFLLILPVVAVFVLLVQRRAPVRACGSAAGLVCCALLVVSPWTIRNAIVFHAFIPVSTNSGMNLLLGNCENAGPDSGANVDIRHYDAEAIGMNEAQADNHYQRCAKQWIMQHPGAAARLYVLKVLNYFNFRNRLAVPSEGDAGKDAVLFLSYYALLGAAVARGLMARRFPLSSTEWLCYGIYFGNAFLSAIFFTRIRFRVPFDALLIVCVAILVGQVRAAWLSRRHLRSARP